MPIEIKITNIKDLTENDITDLSNYLTASRVSKIMETEVERIPKDFYDAWTKEQQENPGKPASASEPPVAEDVIILTEGEYELMVGSERLPPRGKPFTEYTGYVGDSLRMVVFNGDAGTAWVPQHIIDRHEGKLKFDSDQKPIDVRRVGVVDVPTNPNCKIIKPRKKRKTKQEKLDEAYADSCYGEEKIKPESQRTVVFQHQVHTISEEEYQTLKTFGSLNSETLQRLKSEKGKPLEFDEKLGRGGPDTKIFIDEDSSMFTEKELQPVKTDITHADLIAYVLENTRTKKLKFEQVIALAAKFGVSNINELDKHPELLAPFYNELTEVVENG
jgi:hypothetical protein